MTIQRRRKISKKYSEEVPFKTEYSFAKERRVCPMCSRQKLVFDTQEEAEKFIEYSNASDFHKHYTPIRAYYCDACRAWHVTHKERHHFVCFYSLKQAVERLAPDTWTYVGFDKDAQLVEVMKGNDDFVLFPFELMEQITEANEHIERFEIDKYKNKRYIFYLEDDGWDPFADEDDGDEELIDEE